MRLILTELPTWLDDEQLNFDCALRTVEQARVDLSNEDILLLPELIGSRSPGDQYQQAVATLGRRLGCYVVGGTHHRLRGDLHLNSGVVVDGSGRVVSSYHKLRPYGVEGALGVRAGERFGWFEVSGRRVLVLVCADLWFSEVFHQLPAPPDLILVLTFSISQRPSPAASPDWRIRGPPERRPSSRRSASWR
jgi:predicted amidohydrolase